MMILDNRFARDLPELAVEWRAEPAPSPRLLALNESLATELGVDPGWLRSPAGIGLLVGTAVPAGATPVAQAYAGHQFGGYVPRLGDGRALLLGELVDTQGRTRDLHLKGSGRTPFARGGDGLAAVGPMLREYIVSEGMHALGIPTTRVLAVVATGREVQRETMLPGAVLARVASSHLRVGSFQYAAQLCRSTGDFGLLRRLVEHAIARHHPHAAEAENHSLALLDAVVTAQATLVAQWLLVGFIHGVMNTDNMTISGETIDYGPCAFMDQFDPATVFSSIDHGGRYAYENQPTIALWNLARFAEALLPLIADDQGDAVALATNTLGRFQPQFDDAWTTGMRAKLGLSDPVDRQLTDKLIAELLALLPQNRRDYTSSLRALCHDTSPAGLEDWCRRWRALGPDRAAMARVDPVYIPRNHLVEAALNAAAAGDMGPTERLVAAVTAPFEERPGLESYAVSAPEGCGVYRTFCGT